MSRIYQLIIALNLVLVVSGLASAQTPTETPTPTLTPTATPTVVTLHLLTERDSLTLVIPSDQRVGLNGLEFRVLDSQNSLRSVLLSTGFPVLQLTGGLAEPGSCFVYRLASTTNPLPSSCSLTNRVFRLDVARADVFWYDSVLSQPRDIAVYRDGLLLTPCSSTNPDCPILWELPAATPTPTASPTPDILLSTLTAPATIVASAISTATATTPAKGYPCDGTIVFTTGALLNQVKVLPQKNASNTSPAQQGASILILARQNNDGISWFQIQYQNAGERTGWIPIEYVIASSDCP